MYAALAERRSIQVALIRDVQLDLDASTTTLRLLRAHKAGRWMLWQGSPSDQRRSWLKHLWLAGLGNMMTMQLKLAKRCPQRTCTVVRHHQLILAPR